MEPGDATLTEGNRPNTRTQRIKRVSTALLVVPSIIFLAFGLGGALAIFFQNSVLTSGGMGIILPVLTLDNYLALFDEFFASVMLNTLLIALPWSGSQS